jgi:putative FmdB family regulatory protein
MPLYEYECDACGGRFEVIQKFSETTEQCRRCGKGPVRRLTSSPAIQFKGTGWYVTDYAQKGKTGESSSGSSASSEKKSETAKPDSATTSSDTKSSTTPSTTSKD